MVAVMPAFRNSVSVNAVYDWNWCFLMPDTLQVNRIYFLHLTIYIGGLYYTLMRLKSQLVILSGYGNRLVLTIRNKYGEIDLLLYTVSLSTHDARHLLFYVLTVPKSRKVC